MRTILAPLHMLPTVLLTGWAMSGQLAAQQPQPDTGGGLPSVSPDGRRIAFVRTRDGQPDLWVIGVDGSDERRLTNTPQPEGAPHWAADGAEVLFEVVGGPPAPRELRAVRLADGRERVVIPGGGSGWALSPDGRRAVASIGGWPKAQLALVGLDGTLQRTLTDTTGPAFNAAWSPAGSQVAFARFGADRSMHVWVVNADGTGLRQLSNLPASEGGAQWPAWSPDGRQVAVQAGKYNPQPGIAHIYLIDTSTGAPTRLAPHDRAYLDETPAWLPDGRLAFQSNRTGRMEIWIMNADGTGARQVTH